jgi:hypothetical protein
MRAFCHTRKSIICALSLNKVNMLVNYLDEPLISSLQLGTAYRRGNNTIGLEDI